MTNSQRTDEPPLVEIIIRAVEGRLWATPGQLAMMASALNEINSRWDKDKSRQPTRRTIEISRDGENIVYDVREYFGSSSTSYQLNHN